jgi:hypothetical protein
MDPSFYHESFALKERYGIWRFDKRNQAIADAANLFDEDEQVLITVKTIDHALHLLCSEIYRKFQGRCLITINSGKNRGCQWTPLCFVSHHVGWCGCFVGQHVGVSSCPPGQYRKIGSSQLFPLGVSEVSRCRVVCSRDMKGRG